MLTVLEIIKRTTEFLEKRSVESPRLNAELLIGHALDLKRMQLYLQFERLLTEAELEKIRPLVKRRSSREPLQYIVGSTEFCGLKLKVDTRALIPRPETEQLVELIKSHAPSSPLQILDLGTGTGAIALALATEFPNASVTAVDASESALSLAAENVAALGLTGRVNLLASDWFALIPSELRFDLIVSNPPYLSESETDATQPEVHSFEPRMALSSGMLGTEALDGIISESLPRLNRGGFLALETGIDQHRHLLDFATNIGYKKVISCADLSNRDRFVLAFS